MNITTGVANACERKEITNLDGLEAFLQDALKLTHHAKANDVFRLSIRLAGGSLLTTPAEL